VVDAHIKHTVLPYYTTASRLVLLAVFLLLVACQSNDPEVIKALTEQRDTPTLTVTDLETTVLDSGRVKHRIITPLLKRYSNNEEPYDDFPNGLHYISYNSKGDIEAQIKCNNARHFQKDKLWELNNNVEAINAKGEILNTEQLFWDMDKHTVYSDKAVKITGDNEIINGIGFEAKDDLSDYVIKRITNSEVEIEEEF
jgi:LPS export ABC transporter protein LptC